MPPLDPGISSDALAERLRIDVFPRSAGYDPRWQIENLMGPNALWLAEFLTQSMELRTGMRVLDMGCGKALTSIFLAKEFGVEVWAADLWIDPADNQKRIDQAGLEKQVFPIHAEAHALPFAPDFFDVAVSLDAYHYFGTDDLYLGYFSRFVKPEGHIGIVCPGLMVEFGAHIPDHLLPYWVWDFCSFHSPEWWRDHWRKTGLVEVEVADSIPDGWRLWLRWLEICMEAGAAGDPEEAQMLREDAGRNLGFTRVLARRRAHPAFRT